MSFQIAEPDEERLKKCLAEFYHIQVSNALPDEIMSKAMASMNLDDEGAIELLQSFIRQGWLSTGHFREKFFLRPGYVHCFPVVISSEGLEAIK